MTAAEPHAHRDPILDPPRKKKKGLSTGAIIGIGVSVVVHALVGIYLYQNKFKLKEFNYVDDSVDVELVELPPPPTDTPPPPKLQVRVPAPVTTPNPPPPVYIEPTDKDKRVEYDGPVAIVPGPPPPPAPPAPPPPAPRPSVITNVQWSRPPRTTDADYPSRALEREISGSAVVQCTAQANGRPANCRVVSETPSGAGFGAAAVRIVQRGQLSPRTVDGAARDATFTVRIPFNLGG